MANSAKVLITAEYKGGNVKKGLSTTEHAVASLKKQVGALAAAWGVREVAAFSVEVSRLAASAAITERTFAALAKKAGTDMVVELERMREAVGGTLSDLKLMQTVGAAVDAGLTFNQAITALEFLRRYSLAFGKDFESLTKTIFTGLARGSVQFLDDAGLILSATDAMFDGLGDLEKKSALVGEAIRLMGEKMKVLPEIEENAITSTDRLGVAWENLMKAMGKQLGGPTSGASNFLADALNFLSQPVPDEVGLKAEDYAAPFKAAFTGLRFIIDREMGMSTAEAMKRANDFMGVTAARLAETEAKLAEERKKNETAQQARLTASIAANEKFIAQQNKKLEFEKALNDERAREGNVVAFNDKMDGNRQRISDRAFEAEEFRENEARVDAEIAAEAVRLQNKQDVLDQIVKLEAQASGDMRKIRAEDLRSQYRNDIAAARSLGATEEQIERLRQAYKKLYDDIGKEDTIKKILLVFHADASQVKTESDLAAFSLGLLVEKIRGISPGVAEAVSVVEGLATAIQSGNTFSIAAAGISGFISLIGGISGNSASKQAEKSAEEFRKVADSLKDAAEAAGSFANGIANMTQINIIKAWANQIQDLNLATNNAFAGMKQWKPTFGDMIDQIRNGVMVSGNFSGEVALMIAELERLDERIGAVLLGEIHSFADAIGAFNHEIAMSDLEDPTKKLAIYLGYLEDIGIFVGEAGNLYGNTLSVTLADQRRILETIHDFQNEIADVEIEARKEQAAKIVSAIQDQAQAVEDALDDMAEVQKQAALRAVSLAFDVREQALRRAFTPQLTGAAGDPFETARVIQEAQREIALLNLAEQAAGNAALADIRSALEAAREANDSATETLVSAVIAAQENTSAEFAVALSQEMQNLGGNFSTFLSIADGNISGAVEATRLSILGLTDGITVDMAALQKTTGDQTQAIIISLGEVRSKIVDSVVMNAPGGAIDQLRLVMDPLPGKIDTTNETLANMRDSLAQMTLTKPVEAVADYGDPNWPQIRQLLEWNRANTFSLVWGQRGEYLFGKTASGTPGTVSSGGSYSFTFDVDIQSITTGGSGGGNPAQVWNDGIEDAIVDSLQNGRLGTELGKVLRALGVSTQPTIPSSIRT